MEKLFEPLPWSYTTNIYEVNLRQYTKEGTFRAFAKELPRLSEMGVEVLWFMPVTPISLLKRQGTLGSYYACSDYTDANPEFGTVQDFASLVTEAHKLHFKVIIDWVANHTGWDHKWTKTNPGYYKRNDAGEFYDTNNWNDVIDLNYYDQAMRREMIASMKFWIEECDIDGFRCDMAHLVPLDFWRDARRELDQVKPLFWLAETEHVNYAQVFDCCYAWKWMHRTEDFSRRRIGLQELVDVLWKARVEFPGNFFQLFFTANHDENSWNGTEYEKYGGRARALAVFSATWPGIPLIYSGQELPNLKRLKFFEKDHIEWNGRYELHEFYKLLLRLRKQHPALQGGFVNSHTEIIDTGESEYVLGYTRMADMKQVLVLLNLSDAKRNLLLNDRTLTGTYRDIFSGDLFDPSLENKMVIEAGGYKVLVNQAGNDKTP